MSASTPIHPSDRKAVFVGDGELAAFSVPWPIQRPGDVIAFVDGDLVAITSMTPSPAEEYAAIVTLTAAPVAGARVEIVGEAPISRVTSASQGGRIAARTLDQEFDRLTIYAQEQRRNLVEEISRTLRTPEPMPPLPDASARAWRVLSFDSRGDPVAGPLWDGFWLPPAFLPPFLIDGDPEDPLLWADPVFV